MTAPSSPARTAGPSTRLEQLRNGGEVAIGTLRQFLSGVYQDTAQRLAHDAQFQLHARSGRLIFLTRARELTQALEEELASELDAALCAFDAHPLAPPHAETEGVLRGLNEFEQRLLLDRVTYRLSDPSEASFQELGWRLATLYQIKDVPPRHNPFRAAVLFRGVLRALLRLDVYPPAVLPLAQSLDMPLTAPLRMVYREVNRTLEKAGVAALSRTALPETTAVSSLISLSDQFTDQRTQNEVRTDVLRLDTQRPPDTLPALLPSAAPGAPRPDTLSRPATLPAVEPPAAQGADAAAADDAAAVARSIASRSGYELIRFVAGHPPSVSDLRKLGGGARAAKPVRVAIELVHQIFREVVDDEAVPEEFLNLVLHLQLPMLRLTLSHPDYVPGDKTPGRPLVRRLVLASAGWTRKGEFNAQLLEAAQTAVRSVIAQPDAGPEAMHAALLQFVAFLSEAAKAPDNPLERIRKARQLADERRTQEVRIAIELGQKIETRLVPNYLREFLLGPWVRVLRAAREQATTEANFAAPFDALVDELLWSVEDKLDQIERARLTASIPRLLATIYRGLGLIDMQPTDVQDLVSRLMASHAAAAQTVERTSAGGIDRGEGRAAHGPVTLPGTALAGGADSGAPGR